MSALLFSRCGYVGIASFTIDRKTDSGDSETTSHLPIIGQLKQATKGQAVPVKIQRSLNWKGFIIQEVDGDFLARTIVRITYIGANPDEFVLANSVELAKHMINSGEVYNRFDQMHGDGAEFGHVGIKCSGS